MDSVPKRNIRIPRLNSRGNLLHPRVSKVIDMFEYDATPPMSFGDIEQPLRGTLL